MKSSQFVLKLKGTQTYLKSIRTDIWCTTCDVNSALVWECNSDIDELKIDEDLYEIIEI